MNTQIFNCKHHPVDYIVKESVEILRRGGLVIFPTETVYGLGADAFNLKAVEKIYEIKGRKRDNPLIFHVSNFSMIEEIGVVEAEIKELFYNFMPGPLTIVLKSKIPREYTFGLDTVAVRMPDNLIALKMIEKLSKPVVAPSANISGRPSGTELQHVLEDFYGKVEAIIDGGQTVYGIESTVIDVTHQPFLLLRAGAFTLEELESNGIKVILPEKNEVLKRSPGTRYKHYAPNALVIPFESEDEYMRMLLPYKHKKVAKIGIDIEAINSEKVISFKDVEEYARFLYSTFRYLDALAIDVIFAKLPENKGLGLAVRDRIMRASKT